jgi:Domain of unknown function (DUF4349)
MRRPVLCILALVTACAGTGTAAEPTPVADEQVGPLALEPSTIAPVIPVGPVMTRYTNLQIRVADPAASADAARRLLVDAGGEVTNLSSSSDNATLNATLPPEALDRFRHGLSRLPGVVESESSSSGDMTPTVQQLADRLGKLELAEAELDRIMRAATDHAIFDALLTQRELNTRERDSLHMQIASYVQQARRAQLNVNFVSSKPSPDVIRDPIHHGLHE